jgi:Family of unknown function (DUF6174)
MTVRRRALAALALAGALNTLVACGGDDGTTAADPAPTISTAEPTPTTSTAPTTSPEPGSLPDFPYQDYEYTLEMRCFCANIDQAYRITVTGAEVSSVKWATKGDGHVVGEELADDYLRLTIQDIIDRGNDPRAAQVDVTWPAGQEYPTSVYIDKDKMTADEEVTYVISEVDTV